MFGITQDQLISSLKRIREKLCAYCAPPCDCKFMRDKDERICSGSESGSGCPEIYEALELIQAMTPEEFNTIRRRAKITISELDLQDYNKLSETVEKIKSRKNKSKRQA